MTITIVVIFVIKILVINKMNKIIYKDPIDKNYGERSHKYNMNY